MWGSAKKVYTSRHMESVSAHVLRSVLEHQQKNPEIACIDVRNPDEYAEMHIAGVQNIPLGELAAHENELATKKEIYVHCRSGVRSLQACETLEAMHLPARIMNVEGGIMAWQREGLPLV